MLVRQGIELGRPRRVARRIHARVTGALLIGLSTFQAEFDFGVPQFQLLYQPVLIALAAGCALTCARSLLQREATGGPGRLRAAAYAVVAVVIAVWLGLVAWALGLAEARGPARARATVGRPWPPPAAPA